MPSFTCDRTAPRRDDPVPSRSRVARRSLCPARTPRGQTASPLRRRPDPPQPSPDRVQPRVPPSPSLQPLNSMPTAARRMVWGCSSRVPSMVDGIHAAAELPRPPRPHSAIAVLISQHLLRIQGKKIVPTINLIEVSIFNYFRPYKYRKFLKESC